MAEEEIVKQLKSIDEQGVKLLYESLKLLNSGYSMEEVKGYFTKEYIRIYGIEPKM